MSDSNHKTFRELALLYLLTPFWIAGKLIENWCREGRCFLIVFIVFPWSAIFFLIITWLYRHVIIQIH